MHVDDDDDDDDDDDLDNLTSFPEPLGQAHDMFFHEFFDYQMFALSVTSKIEFSNSSNLQFSNFKSRKIPLKSKSKA